MHESCFKRACLDVVESENWLQISFRLALLLVIPLFGQIVVYGYALGWAREAAWGVKTPLSQSILNNQGESFFRRGLFALVIVAVYLFGLIVVRIVWSAFVVSGPVSLLFDLGVYSFVDLIVNAVSAVLWVVLALAAAVFSLIGLIRMSIYNRLGPGFQLETIWNMFRHRSTDVFSIVGWSVVWLLGSLSLCAAAGSVTAAVFYFLMTIAEEVAVTGLFVSGVTSMLLGMIALGFVLITAVFYHWVGVLSALVISRSFGLWAQQFEVARWRGQDDPLPFEREGTLF